MKLFDTHTHYDDIAFENDRHEVVSRLLSDNVAGFVAVGCTLERSELAVQLAEKYPQAYSAVGIHPQCVCDLPDDYLQTLKNLAASPKIRAIGEIGLEYCREYNKNLQMKIFREQLDLAARLNLPVIVHCREAFPDIFEILGDYKSKHNLNAVCHCFSGDGRDAEKLAEIGISVSFTGNIAFKKAERAEDACKNMPLELIMLETDCPYLAPPPFRGKRCDSGMMYYTAEKIAQIKRVSTEKVIETCNNNAKNFFKIEF